MSSAVVSTSAALGRPFIFDADLEPNCHPERSGDGAKRSPRGVEGSLPSSDPRFANILPASQLAIRPMPEMAPSGIAEFDALTGGLPRGCLTEICGPASSGRTTVLLSALAAATRRGEYCALIDASDALDAQSLAASGIDLDRLLWVRCGEDSPAHPSTKKSFRPSEKTNPAEHRLEQLLKATDLLLESGGFGMIVLDLADVTLQVARRIPLTTWFRFRRAVEHKPTILLAIEHQPIAGSCSSLLLQLKVPSSPFSVLSSRRQVAGAECTSARSTRPTHAHLLTGLEINVELARSRVDRKPACSIAFETKTAWAG
ncbi:MAG TPA: hypothetical protein VMB66_11810 [Candidatus Acidoferrales bacterium]|nr:hypothetical protein [Candidatus Acidoferrales bacterium]